MGQIELFFYERLVIQFTSYNSIKWLYLKPINSLRTIFLPSWLELEPTAPQQRGKPPTPMSVLIYDTKQSDDEVPVMLRLSGMWSTPSLLLLSGPLWPGAVAPDRVLSVLILN